MSLQTIVNINVDFCDNKYILINAKQYDDSSRWIYITCYNNGDIFNLSANKHSAYVKYKKADGHAVLNFCNIDYKGRVLVELTEQMLSVDGICYVELVVINKGSAIVNIDTGEITSIDDTSILSTMAFCVNVYETTVDNSVIESSNEYEGLVQALEYANAEYQRVITLSKSYATGEGGGIRDNEEVDNSKYYSQLSRSYAIGDANNIRENEDTDNAKYYANEAKTSEINASNSASAASVSEANAKASEVAAYLSETNASVSESNARASEVAAKESETNASNSASAASISEANAKTSEVAAKESETNAKASEVASSVSETNAANSASAASESETNAHNYCEIVKSVADGLNSGFIPIGTISFSELATAEKATGFTYNIRDDFVTDDTFREGAGMTYTAGTNVYYTSDGYWDCFGGSASPTATVNEVKTYLGI